MVNVFLLLRLKIGLIFDKSPGKLPILRASAFYAIFLSEFARALTSLVAIPRVGFVPSPFPPTF